MERSRDAAFYVPTDQLTLVNGEYLLKGDRFVARGMSTGPHVNKMIMGVADMDGMMVSPTYGYRTNPDWRKQRERDPEYNAYISVYLDGVIYEFGNESLHTYEWSFYVNSDIVTRIREDMQQNRRWHEKSDLQTKIEQAVKDVNTARQTLDRLKRQLDAINKEVTK